MGAFGPHTGDSAIYSTNLFKPSEIKHHQAASDSWSGEMRRERECECEERRIVLLRNQESRLCVVGLDLKEMRMCLVSGTLSVGEQNRSKGLVESTVWWLPGWASGSRLCRVQELVADPMSESWWTSTLHISDVDGGPCGIFPRMYIWADLSYWGGWILGAMILECMFRLCDWTTCLELHEFCFWGLQELTFNFYFVLEHGSLTTLYYLQGCSNLISLYE